MFDLFNKTALVTGATGGIGHEIAKIFHKAGATVILSGTRESVLQDIAKELGERVHVIPFNLADSANANKLFEQAEVIAPIDILVCNAGITRDNLLIRMSDEEWDQVLNLNLKTAFKLNQAAAKAMSKRGNGRIINISSIVALSGNFGQANYAAAKGGLISMTKTVAQELARKKVTANCIAPGFISTPMTDVLNDNIKEKVIAKIPMQEMGTPKDIANAALYLASDEARYITGHVLSVNGGMYM